MFITAIIIIVKDQKPKPVSCNSIVILIRQTCDQRSSSPGWREATRALAFYFSVRIWYMFFISICRGKLDLGVCMTSVLAKRKRPHSADFRFKNVFGHWIRRKSALRSWILFASTEVMHTPRSHSLPKYNSILRTYTRFSQKSKILALGICFLQPHCMPHVYGIKITFELLPTICFVSTTTNWRKDLTHGCCVLN